MNPIIAAFDDHEHADAALRWAAELAHLTDAPLRVVSVYEPTYSEIAPDWLRQQLHDRESRIAGVLNEVNGRDAEVEVLTSADPLHAIAEFLDEHDAAMVTIGLGGSGAPGGLGAAAPAHHLIRQSHVPITIIPPDHRALAHGHVVVGVDGSEANSVALARAATIAQSVDGDLQGVFAYDPMDDTFGHPDRWHRHSAEVRTEFAKTGVDESKLYMAAGHPTDVLVEHAQREMAAAVVVGTRGRGGFGGLRVGRVPVQLIEHAPCPIVVVPH